MQTRPSAVDAASVDSIEPPEYWSGYLSTGEGEHLFQQAQSSLVWHSETFTIFGRERTVPRQISWVADVGLDYRYAARSHVGTGWPSWLVGVVQRIASDFDRFDNHLLLNRYRCGSDHMGWHRDDERGVVGEVLVLSLGAPRTLRWRIGAMGKSQPLLLEHGSLLRLDGRLYHKLMAAPGQQGERISMTFRQIAPSLKPGGDRVR
jgi:alkylated DNA repair dioxygenase AlkB